MKRTVYLIYMLVLITVGTFAQAPQLINYQGVARNSGGNILQGQTIGLELTVRSGSINGSIEYQEIHTPTTNQFGLFNIQIGGGTPVTGNFGGIDWGSNSHYLQVKMDPNGGTSYTVNETSQLISVPYALYAESSGSNSVNGSTNYVAKFTPNGSTLGNSSIFDNGTSVGIGTTNPDDKLDVSGNTQVSGYLKVGNPSTPSSWASYSAIPLYKLSYLSGAEGWSQASTCGSPSGWWINTSGTNSGMIYFDNVGSYHRSWESSPWIWVPTGSSNLTVEGTYYCGLEDNYDGVFLEYRIDGGSWTKITSFDFGGYVDNAYGCNTTCDGSDYQSCWNGIFDTKTFRVTSSTFQNVAGHWIRFRYVAMESSSGSSGEFDVKGFNVTAFGGTTIGGSFATGNIYAEKNVYAGSNVLLGDVAEYFKVQTATEPGDLIALDPVKVGRYTVSDQAFSQYILGIHSTDPTVTVNAPDGTPVCLTGRVPVKVSGENGSIRIGDYLTSASVRGHAMRADRPCFVIGRALEDFAASSSEKGKILCLAETGWYETGSSTAVRSGGNSSIQENSCTVAVNDPNVKADSRVFITMHENVGGYWVSDITDGRFTLNIEKTTDRDAPFDYFVDNARNPKVDSDDLDGNTHTVGKEPVFAANEKPVDRKTCMAYTEEEPPGMPPEPKAAWTWLPDTGFLRSRTDQ